MSASNFLENEVLDHILGTASYTAPSNVYLALYTSDPGEGNTGTELSGNGYSRQLITFTTASGGVATNSSEETFTASGGNFGTITHYALFDASTSGNMLMYAPLTTPRTVSDGESLRVPVGAISITVT